MAPAIQRRIWEAGTRRSNVGRDAVSAVATGGCYDGNERAGQDRPSRVLDYFRPALADLLSLDELPRRATCLCLEDRDEATLWVAVLVERHRADDAVGDVRVEHLRDDVLTGAVGTADRIHEHLRGRRSVGRVDLR